MARSTSPRPDIAAERAAAQEQNRRLRASRQADLDAAFADGTPGSALITVDLVATALFVVTGAVAAIGYRPLSASPVAWPAAVVSLLLFIGGCGLFLVALIEGARRSRRSLLGIGGWFLLSGSAPQSVQRRLNGALAIQVIAGIGFAAARPFTALAFATLVPVFGLAVNGIWAARYGWFVDRPAEDVR